MCTYQIFVHCCQNLLNLRSGSLSDKTYKLAVKLMETVVILQVQTGCQFLFVLIIKTERVFQLRHKPFSFLPDVHINTEGLLWSVRNELKGLPWLVFSLYKTRRNNNCFLIRWIAQSPLYILKKQSFPPLFNCLFSIITHLTFRPPELTLVGLKLNIRLPADQCLIT